MNREEISIAVGDPEAADPELLSLDALLDLALMHSFPASDPPALVSPNGRRSMDRASAAPGRAGEQARAPERRDGLEGSATT
jgi:hypothetical protein